MHRAGYVLTGGGSTRMGRDKALLPFRGVPLAIHVAQIVRQAAGSVTLAGKAGRFEGYGIPFLEDHHEGCGPLGGIHAILESTTAKWSLVVACDMPLLDAGFLRLLLDTAGRQDCHAVLARNRQGLPEPLCAVYRADSLVAVRAALQAGKLKIMDALNPLELVFVEPADPAWLANANTPEDWAQWAPEATVD